MLLSKEEWLAEMSDSLGVDPEDVVEVAAMFFDAIDQRLQKIASAYQNGETSELTRLVHGLKGDTANMRFHESSRLARELELESRAGHIHDFERKFKALCDAITRQKHILQLDEM